MMKLAIHVKLAINVLLFQAGWFACVLSAAQGLPWIGSVVVGSAIVWHLTESARPKRELVLIAAAALVGALFETFLVQTGWLRFNSGNVLAGAAPYWMIALWALFATTLNVSLRWLRSRPGIAVLFGAIGGPASYYAGARLGAIEFVHAGAAFTAIAFGWALATPVLISFAQRLDGYTPS